MAPGFTIDMADMEVLIDMLAERAAKGDLRAHRIMAEFLEALGIEPRQEQCDSAAPRAQGTLVHFSGHRWWS